MCACVCVCVCEWGRVCVSVCLCFNEITFYLFYIWTQWHDFWFERFIGFLIKFQSWSIRYFFTIHHAYAINGEVSRSIGDEWWSAWWHYGSCINLLTHHCIALFAHLTIQTISCCDPKRCVVGIDSILGMKEEEKKRTATLVNINDLEYYVCGWLCEDMMMYGTYDTEISSSCD